MALLAVCVPDTLIVFLVFFLSCTIRNNGIPQVEKYSTRLVKNWYLDAGAQKPLW
jgi:anaerobic C4-dicarboxylate transporter